MIECEDLVVRYATDPVLAGVSLAAQSGRVLGLIGPNGSGKTTLLRTLYAALTPEAGQVHVEDQPVVQMPARQRARRLAVVAQEGSDALTMSVADLVLLGRSPHRSSLRAYSTEDHQIAAAALVQVGMRGFADRDVGQLSGGERQRALIGRALAQRADYLLLDEPTNHLDVHYQHEILGLVRDLGCTTVVVLHDLNLAAQYCDDLVLLDRGRIAAAGPIEHVLTPGVLEPVYRVAVHRHHHEGRLHLLLSPAPPIDPPLNAASGHDRRG